MLNEQIFITSVESYYTRCDVIIIANSEKAEVNTLENSNVS